MMKALRVLLRLVLIVVPPVLLISAVYMKARQPIIDKHGRKMWELWNLIQVENPKIRSMIPFLRRNDTPPEMYSWGVRVDNGAV